MPRIREESAIPKDRMRITQIGPRIAVRFDGRVKVVAGADARRVARRQPRGPQIYDLGVDPDERENLYETPEGRKRYDALWRRYREWRRETRDADARFLGESRPLSDAEDHIRMLEALGYVSDGTK